MSIPSRLMRHESKLPTMPFFPFGCSRRVSSDIRVAGKPTSIGCSPLCIVVFTLLTAIAGNCYARAPEPVRLRRGEVVLSVEQRSNGERFLKAKILLDAPLPVVWEAVRKERDPDLEWSRIARQVSLHETIVEEKFKPLPLIGPVRCVRKITERPYQRIDYKLVTSDHFKALEGSWVLTTSEDERFVVVELSSHVELDRWAPRFAIEHVGLRKLEQRLRRIRESVRPHGP